MRFRNALWCAALAALVLASIGPLIAQVPPSRVSPIIPSLSAPDEGLVIRDRALQNGRPTFASSPRGVLLPVERGASAEARGLKFVELYGANFGLASVSQVRLARSPSIDDLGIEHVRFQQLHDGIPVTGGELLVHLDGDRVVAVNGHVLEDLPKDVTPAIPASLAIEAARQLIEKHHADRAAGAQYSEPRLEIFNRGMLSDESALGSRLAWFVEARGEWLRQYIWIDAKGGEHLLDFSQMTEARNREIYNANHLLTLPGTLSRVEGGPPTGDSDMDNAYTYAGITYDYFFNNHARDSYDNAGAKIKSVCHYCPSGYPQGSTCPTYQNASWDGTYMKYADGFTTADDVVAHELTHAVTEYGANLFYYMQSGALNESFSDIFGETVDLLDGVGNDAPAVRWKMGEDLPVGAIRDMMNPNASPGSDPGKMSDAAYFVCGSGDGGGVHSNSGVPNHAYALMVDGGTYNNTTITGIGLTKAAKVQYRALTVYLTSGSGFRDAFNALTQSCTDLIGTAGITGADCTEVTKALQAVEMANRWPCTGAVQAPPLCPSGSAVNLFFDGFEAVTSNWTLTNAAGGWNVRDSGWAKSGVYMAFGSDPSSVSDHRATRAAGVALPAGARLYFDHAYTFESGTSSFFDGGVVEYSVNGGANWIDAGSLIDAGRGYNGALSGCCSNPLAGRSAFGANSFGYTGTRLNLSTLAGQTFLFRFRIASDSTVSSLGWVLDNVQLYTCSTVPTGLISVVDGISYLGTVNVGAETSAVAGNTGTVLTDVARTSSGAMWGIDYLNLYAINPVTGARTLIGPLGAGGGGMNALVGHGATLLAASNATTSLYTVNTSTGAATALSGSLGYPSMGDLAFNNGMLYAAVQNGSFTDLVRVTLAGSTFTATNLGHVTSDNLLYGLAQGLDHNLYGFTGTTVVRINTANPAASTVAVPNYNVNLSGLGAAAGAASPPLAPFTNDPLTAGTPILAQHINELRARIGAVRTAWGLGSFTWTDAALIPNVTPIKAAHVSELRTALSQAYTMAGAPSPVFTDPVVAFGLAAKRLHILELRATLTAIE